MIDFRGRRVLVVAPHTDDEISCGGTIVRAIEEGAQVLVLACCPCHEVVPKAYPPQTLEEECKASCATLGAQVEIAEFAVRRLEDRRQELLDLVVELSKDYNPHIVLCPSSTDFHQDHRTVYLETTRACKTVELLLGWEAPNNQRVARVDCFMTLTEQHLDTKLAAWQHYKTQHGRTYYDDEMFRAMARLRGRQARTRTGLAEGFETLSMIVR